MCGIFGVINFSDNNVEIDINKFQAALEKMSHRGPDYQGIVRISSNAVFGHLRLSIIDTSVKSNQPFYKDGYWIVYNGEIFNYTELRDELVGYGYYFDTSGDTEVLITSFIHWGEECVNRLNGMWSFVIYNSRTEDYFCSRDRFGVKPFYYYANKNVFVFSSEIKSILEYCPNVRKPNYNVISNFCRFSSGGELLETWFEDIYRLAPAHVLTIKGNNFTQKRFWSYPVDSLNVSCEKDIIESYKKIFGDSVNVRLRSDVPLGVTLSSGIDSNSILAYMIKNQDISFSTFTSAMADSGFSGLDRFAYNASNVNLSEAEYLKNHFQYDKNLLNFINVDYSDYVTELKKIIYHLDSGHSSPAIFPYMQTLKEAKKKVTVVLEGQGADELLGGYVFSYFFDIVLHFALRGRFGYVISLFNTYKKYYSLKFAFKSYFRRLSTKYDLIYYVYARFIGIDRLFVGNLKKYRRLKEKIDIQYNSMDILNRILVEQHRTTLVNLLHYGDSISMANSIESRLPFMDYRLVEFAFKLPLDSKFKNGLGKYIHRAAMVGEVQESILNNPLKIGFNSPLSDLFSSNCELNLKPIDILLSDKFKSRNLIDQRVLKNLINQTNIGKANHSYLLYRLLCVELWFQVFIDKE